MPAKKTTRKTIVRKPVAKQAPVMENTCACGENCRCHCHGGAHIIKHIIVWAIIFALGMVCGKMMCCHHGKHMPKMNPVFENGCLQMQSIQCPKMVEKLANADVNGDGCVSMEEYKAVKKEMKRDMRKHRGFDESNEPQTPEMDD